MHRRTTTTTGTRRTIPLFGSCPKSPMNWSSNRQTVRVSCQKRRIWLQNGARFSIIGLNRAKRFDYLIWLLNKHCFTGLESSKRLGRNTWQFSQHLQNGAQNAGWRHDLQCRARDSYRLLSLENTQSIQWVSQRVFFVWTAMYEIINFGHLTIFNSGYKIWASYAI